MEQAKENIDAKFNEAHDGENNVKPISAQIQNEYKKLDKVFFNSVGFLKDEIIENPDKFDSDYRNLYSFVKMK
jgi:hypothetical protein